METAVLSKSLVLKGSNNRDMELDIRINSEMLNSRPVLIFCHGYKGFKDWGCWNLVADKFSKSGFNFIKFNFSHNGVTVNTPKDFVDLEAFGNNNYSKELFDLKAIINWVCENREYHDFFDISQIYLIGHSRGGGIVSLAAAKDSRVKKVSTWASVFDLTDRLPTNIEQWKEEGVVYQKNGRTNQNMPLYFQFYENTELNSDELSIKKWGDKITIPFCIIHGTNDLAVSHAEAEKLDEIIPTSELILLENASHTFGSSHPWEKNYLSDDLNRVVDETIDFLKQKNTD